jgi:hypothetical protein
MKRELALGLLVAIMSASAFGAGIIGPPTAELKKGQWSGGYDYMYSDMDLDKTTVDWVEDLLGATVYFGTDRLKIKDFKIHRHYATVGYGLADWWEANFRLGIADVKAQFEGDSESFGLNFDNDFAWGWGTKVTFHKQEKISWGASVQMNWLDASWDGTMDFPHMARSGAGDVDLDTHDLLVAIGPTADMGAWKLYGGPFYYYLSGEWEAKGGDSAGYGWRETADIEANSNFGAFVGAQFGLAQNTDLTTEFSFTGDGWAFGAGVALKF